MDTKSCRPQFSAAGRDQHSFTTILAGPLKRPRERLCFLMQTPARTATSS